MKHAKSLLLLGVLLAPIAAQSNIVIDYSWGGGLYTGVLQMRDEYVPGPDVDLHQFIDLQFDEPFVIRDGAESVDARQRGYADLCAFTRCSTFGHSDLFTQVDALDLRTYPPIVDVGDLMRFLQDPYNALPPYVGQPEITVAGWSEAYESKVPEPPVLALLLLAGFFMRGMLVPCRTK